MKKSQLIIVAASACLLLLCACKKEGLYYWGDYSQTYYNYMKEPCDETYNAHMQSLEKVVQESEKRKKAVPPGVFSEYGYYMLKAGNTSQAAEMFRREKLLYPESTVFMDRLIDKCGENPDAEEAKATDEGAPSESGAATGADVQPAQEQATSSNQQGADNAAPAM